MNVLYICGSLSGGGAQKLLNDMLPIMAAKDGLECELLLVTDKNAKYLQNLTEQGIKITIIPPHFTSHLSRLHYIANFMEKNRFDIVHANLFPTFYYCSLIKKIKQLNIKLFMTEHSTDNRRRHIRLARPLEKWIYSSYDKVICISPETQAALCSWLEDNRKEKFPVIFNGVPIEQYLKALPYNRENVFPGISGNDVLLCMVGSFTNQKNHAFMVEVMKYLPAKYKILFVGEGKLKDGIEKLVCEYNLQDRIKFFGFRMDAVNLMATSDIVVVPSKWEGFGLVAVEAMACGKPVVCSNVPGVAGVIGDAGLASEIEDPVAFANAIIRFEDHDFYKGCSSKAYIRAQQFEIHTMCEEYLKAYGFYD